MNGPNAASGCGRAVDVGAYLLGALPPEELARFVDHLPTCRACRDEVAELQVVVDSLPIATPQMAPSPELRDCIMRVVDAEAELLRAAGPDADRVVVPSVTGWRWGSGLRLRPLAAGALAGILIAVGVAGGVLLGGGSDEVTPTRSVVARVVALGATAMVSVQHDQATLHVTRLPVAPVGRVYQVWIKRGTAISPTQTLFDVRRSDGSAVVLIEESIADADQVLVTDEPDGGSPSPTRTPIISAWLS